MFGKLHYITVYIIKRFMYHPNCIQDILKCSETMVNSWKQKKFLLLSEKKICEKNLRELTKRLLKSNSIGLVSGFNSGFLPFFIKLLTHFSLFFCCSSVALCIPYKCQIS